MRGTPSHLRLRLSHGVLLLQLLVGCSEEESCCANCRGPNTACFRCSSGQQREECGGMGEECEGLEGLELCQCGTAFGTDEGGSCVVVAGVAIYTLGPEACQVPAPFSPYDACSFHGFHEDSDVSDLLVCE